MMVEDEARESSRRQSRWDYELDSSKSMNGAMLRAANRVQTPQERHGMWITGMVEFYDLCMKSPFEEASGKVERT